MSIESAIDLYERTLKPYRQASIQSEIANRILDVSLHSDVVHLFWIYYNVLGVYMTEPVEDWINRAGDATIAMGFEACGKELKKHARHEAGHQRMMQRDHEALIQYWNRNHDVAIDLNSFSIDPLPGIVKEYIDLHENNIKSASPYGQIAIQYEIESLAPILGPKQIQFTRDKCGDEVLKRLSFICDHVEIDIAHTEFNYLVLKDFLEQHPETLDPLIQTGKEASTIYLRFFDDCMQKAKALYSKLQEQSVPA
jgi:hypothetical protein